MLYTRFRILLFYFVPLILGIRSRKQAKSSQAQNPVASCESNIDYRQVLSTRHESTTSIPCTERHYSHPELVWCFDLTSSLDTTSNTTRIVSPFVEIELLQPMVIREVRLIPVPKEVSRVDAIKSTSKNNTIRKLSDASMNQDDNLPLPAAFRINAAIGKHPFRWYKTLSGQQQGAGWSIVDVGREGHVYFEQDLRGHIFRFWPYLSGQNIGIDKYRLGFHLQLFGCPVSQTQTMQLRFTSSLATIIDRYRSLDAFRSELQGYVCQLLSFAVSGFDGCDRVLFVGMAQAKASQFEISKTSVAVVDKRMEAYAPSNNRIRNVIIKFRILPADVSCEYCLTPNMVIASFQSQLQRTDSKAYVLMKQVEDWITDDRPYFCSEASCAAGQQCVNGVCVDSNGDFSEPAEESLAKSYADLILRQHIPRQSLVIDARKRSKDQNVGSDIPEYRYDQTLLALRPLPIIESGKLSKNEIFVNPVSGAVETNGVTEEALAFQASNVGAVSRLAYWKRFSIPIAVTLSILLVIVLAVLWRTLKST